MGSVAATIDETFAPAGTEWERVSPKLTSARRITATIALVIPVAAVVILALIPTVPVWVPVAVGAVSAAGYVWVLWYVGRRTRSYGYAERADDLLVTRGFMFRTLVIVPYGRMQLVDLAAGPIDRAFGIATLQLHTAAATTDAKIPGLPPEVAAAMRDRLAALGEERAAGL